MTDPHTLWAVAQLVPGEGIEDGVARIAALLAEPDCRTCSHYSATKLRQACGICTEAADELERLQTAMNRYSEDEVRLTHQSTIAAQAEQIDRLRAEVARLTKIIDDAWGEA